MNILALDPLTPLGWLALLLLVAAVAFAAGCKLTWWLVAVRSNRRTRSLASSVVRRRR